MGLDLPPIWLAVFIAIAWIISRTFPGGTLDIPYQANIAVVLFVIGIVLMGLAALEMMRARTTIIPKRTPKSLVTTGVFRFSRNPIYLGDAFVLTAAVLWLNAAPAVVLVPIFVWLIQRRFIAGEENGLRMSFDVEFEEWRMKTRRWL